MSSGGKDPSARARARQWHAAEEGAAASGVPPRPRTSRPPSGDERPGGSVAPESEYASGIQELSRGTSPTVSVPRERRGSVTISLEAQSILTAKTVSRADVRGAARLLEQVLRIPPRSALMLLCSTEEEASLGAAFLTAAGELGVHPVVYLLEPTDAANPVFLKRLEVQLADVAACVAIEGPTPLPAALLEAVRGRVASVWIHAHTEAVARQALRADLDELHRLGVAVSRRLERAPSVEITSGLKASLSVELDPSRASAHRGGVCSPDEPLVLPAGQLTVACARADGTVLADGGVWLADGSVVGRGCPIELELAHGFIARASGSAELEDLLGEAPALRRVGALGFGTNTSLVAGVGARALDLCLPGAYLLLGELDDPSRMVAAVPRRPGLRCGEETWMVRGRWARELV